MVTNDQRKAAAALLRSLAPAQTAELGELFARGRHELALLNAFASIGLTMEKFLWDVSLYSMQEFAFIRLPDALPTALRADIARIDELWSEGLARFGGPFLAGARFGAVDAFFAPVAFRIQTYGLSLGAAASAYAQRLLQLSGMRRWYASALQETWRDEAHEQDARQSGSVWQDLRTPAA